MKSVAKYLAKEGLHNWRFRKSGKLRTHEVRTNRVFTELRGIVFRSGRLFWLLLGGSPHCRRTHAVALCMSERLAIHKLLSANSVIS